MENNKMKKLLSLFAAIVVLSGCSSLGGMFGGAECDSKLARDFMANAEDRIFFAFDSSAITDNSAEILQTQVKWLKKHQNVNVIVQESLPFLMVKNVRQYWATTKLPGLRTVVL